MHVKYIRKKCALISLQNIVIVMKKKSVDFDINHNIISLVCYNINKKT